MNGHVLDEVCEVIKLPQFDPSAYKKTVDPESIELDTLKSLAMGICDTGELTLMFAPPRPNHDRTRLSCHHVSEQVTSTCRESQFGGIARQRQGPCVGKIVVVGLRRKHARIHERYYI